ncbi:MAG: SDR family oxidoreductase [Caldilineaceae bacterium]
MSLSRFRLDGSVVIITGAGRGIGAAIARVFADAGANLLICSRTEADLLELRAQLQSDSTQVHTIALDLANPKHASILISEAVAHFGRIDTIVNNVGGANPGGFLATSWSDIDKAISFNLATAHELTRLAVPHLLEAQQNAINNQARSSPSVISISSIYGQRPGKGLIAYGVAKAAILHWTRLAAVELAPHIRVNAIAAGIIETSATEKAFQDAALRRKFEKSSSLERIGTAEDVADGALYLASPAASFVTGTILEIDGGAGENRLDSL